MESSNERARSVTFSRTLIDRDPNRGLEMRPSMRVKSERQIDAGVSEGRWPPTTGSSSATARLRAGVALCRTTKQERKRTRGVWNLSPRGVPRRAGFAPRSASASCPRRAHDGAAPPFPNDVSSSELGFWVVGGAETRRRILGPTMWLFPDQHWSIVRFQSDARSGLSRYTVLHETVRIDRQSSYS